jgi:hypothetical protein
MFRRKHNFGGYIFEYDEEGRMVNVYHVARIRFGALTTE